MMDLDEEDFSKADQQAFKLVLAQAKSGPGTVSTLVLERPSTSPDQEFDSINALLAASEIQAHEDGALSKPGLPPTTVGFTAINPGTDLLPEFWTTDELAAIEGDFNNMASITNYLATLPSPSSTNKLVLRSSLALFRTPAPVETPPLTTGATGHAPDLRSTTPDQLIQLIGQTELGKSRAVILRRHVMLIAYQYLSVHTAELMANRSEADRIKPRRYFEEMIKAPLLQLYQKMLPKTTMKTFNQYFLGGSRYEALIDLCGPGVIAVNPRKGLKITER
ncbi:MAG: hypothetical protein M1829_002921 [Trizodia sp. TS-e1964]|nr:MAG: hypothetical protein M1829_002921 [Trizodia sp. TS-e1964]